MSRQSKDIFIAYNKFIVFGLVAQLVEQLTLNHTLRNEYKLHLWTSSSVGRATDS